MIPFKQGGQWVWLGGPRLAKIRAKANRPPAPETITILRRRPNGDTTVVKTIKVQP